jgi:SMI1 / KNR4 family (SUKH-1)
LSFRSEAEESAVVFAFVPGFAISDSHDAQADPLPGAKRYTLLVPGLDTSRITNTLAFLRDMQRPVFGADVHGFRLNPPVPEADVVAFENSHNTSLPHDFRQFLTEVGNGGAGPFYGVFPLGRMDDNFGLRTWHENDGFVGVLSEPFPLRDEWNDTSSQPSAELANRDESEYWKQMDMFQSKYWRSSLVNGAIPICHEGCALRIWLVLTGPQAGYLWEDRRAEYAGLKPL